MSQPHTKNFTSASHIICGRITRLFHVTGVVFFGMFIIQGYTCIINTSIEVSWSGSQINPYDFFSFASSFSIQCGRL